MSSNLSPYIGVTGFTARSEIEAALAALPAETSYRLMAGVLVSSKTLAGERNRWAHRYPPVSSISRIFSPNERSLNLIHYSTDSRDTLTDQIATLIELGGPNLDGFQFNISWPLPAAIEPTAGRRVVLQLGRTALEQMDCNPLRTALRLEDYRSIITDVLIDKSGGRGESVCLHDALEYVQAIRDRHPWLGVGVAGGLSGSAAEALRALLEAEPPISIDAEGKLRTPDDRLDLSAVAAYVRLAGRLCTDRKRKNR